MTLMDRQRGVIRSGLFGSDPAADWRAAAACRNEDPELFHPVGDKWHPDDPRATAAKAICATCPTVAECLTHAETVGDQWAILGGLTPKERSAARLRDSRIHQRHCQRCQSLFWTRRARYCSQQCRDEAAKAMRSTMGRRRQEVIT